MRQQRSHRRAFLALALLAIIAAGWALPAVAEAYYARRTTRTTVNGCCRGGYHHRDVHVHRDVDVDVDYHHHHPVATAVGVAAVATATAAVIGTIVHTLPPACSAVIVNGITYQNCGGVWYQPQYAGPQITYVVVNPPR
jgi:hypothetical protein